MRLGDRKDNIKRAIVSKAKDNLRIRNLFPHAKLDGVDAFLKIHRFEVIFCPAPKTTPILKSFAMLNQNTHSLDLSPRTEEVKGKLFRSYSQVIHKGAAR